MELQVKNTDSLANSLRQISSCYKDVENNICENTIFNTKAPENSRFIYGKDSSGENASKAVSWIAGSVSGSSTILGMKTEGEIFGEIGGASWENKYTSGVKFKDGKLDSISLFDAKIAGEAHVAKGTIGGSIGAVSLSGEAVIGQVKSEGSVGATLYKNGKLAPQISIGGELSGAAVSGNIKGTIGSDNTNVHASAKGEVLSGDLKGNLGIGKVTYKGNDGTVKTGYGVSTELKAEAYAAQGEVKGGFTLFGIKFDVGVTGKAGGAGGSIGGHATAGSVGGSISAGLGLGIGINFNIDWTGFKWGW